MRRADPGRDRFDLLPQRWAAGRARRIAVNSAAVRSYCVDRGLPAAKCVVIPNGVAIAERPAWSRRQMLVELGLPEHARLLVVAGPLELRKRIKDAIWATDLLKVVRDDVHLLVVGEGPHRPRLERFRDCVVIRDRVHFLGDRADLRTILPNADALLATGVGEGQSNTILEAMACGLPVVAVDCPGNRDLIVHEQTGVLVRVGDRAALARWAGVLLDEPDLASRLGAAGRRRAEEDFGVAAMVARHAALYDELLGGRS